MTTFSLCHSNDTQLDSLKRYSGTEGHFVSHGVCFPSERALIIISSVPAINILAF